MGRIHTRNAPSGWPSRRATGCPPTDDTCPRRRVRQLWRFRREIGHDSGLRLLPDEPPPQRLDGPH
eukprot:10697739-Alexandrium_andersonii.AAC.1